MAIQALACFGTTSRQLANTGGVEYWFLLEAPTARRRRALPWQPREPESTRSAKRSTAAGLAIDGLLAAVVHMHSLDPPVAHRDLKLENVLGLGGGRFVLCDFGSATTTVLPATRARSTALAEEDRIQKYSTLMYRAPEMVDLYRNQEVGPRTLGARLHPLPLLPRAPVCLESSLQILNGGTSCSTTL